MHSPAFHRLALALALLHGTGASAAQAATLAGRVVADPRASVSITADQAGQLEAPDGGFPAPGQRLRPGQVVAWLRPSIPAPERRDLDAQLATAGRDVALGELQVRRFNAPDAEQFDGQLAIPSLQILGDYHSAKQRYAQYETALGGRIALVATRGGTVLASRARSDRTLVGGETLFELGDADGLAVEALSAQAPGSATGFDLAVPRHGAAVPLRLVARSFDAQRRAHRLLFAVEGESALRVGEPVRLLSRQAPR